MKEVRDRMNFIAHNGETREIAQQLRAQQLLFYNLKKNLKKIIIFKKNTASLSQARVSILSIHLLAYNHL